ncbi:TPA: hypothetical protein JBH59_05595 [Legionella pneumophila]|uniref:Uncharacterized protein n=1 Tax=Legionella jamestowniensis TaxID=455 RepID=A0A0W0ULB1_9GAMM|nr:MULTISPECIES: hypothetical protein [Legionella]HAT8850027.1 hypothetical protein [Legionella pneumophila subsp. pneumophila]KTD08397.1 hypothetical protein Ljam_2592 [Legionella jamestowniensis]CZI71310.1 Uncharacterised protein [Legionella pneumophila]CZI71544.1 Uncharacterised protein [Legionella pneumophila]CZP34915.1 Uncharacterised protein [Legionella pneumophila]
MPRIKSLITRFNIDEAQKAHNCQANNKHRIEKGNKRLKVSNQRSWDHYCLDCGKKIVQRDIVKLQKLLEELN